MSTTTDSTPDPTSDPVAFLVHALRDVGIDAGYVQVTTVLAQLIGSPTRHTRWHLVHGTRLQGTQNGEILIKGRTNWQP